MPIVHKIFKPIRRAGKTVPKALDILSPVHGLTVLHAMKSPEKNEEATAIANVESAFSSQGMGSPYPVP
jgi:hypothetical protein